MEQKYILMICLVLGLLMNSSSCSERKGDQLPIINTMFINYSTYNLTFNYGNSLEHIIKLNANDTIRKCDTLNSLVDWLASGNHNTMIYGDSSIIVFNYRIYDDSTTTESGKYYRTCKFTDSILNDIKNSMILKGILTERNK